MVLSLTVIHQHTSVYTFTHWDMFCFKQEQLPSEDNIYVYSWTWTCLVSSMSNISLVSEHWWRPVLWQHSIFRWIYNCICI